LNVTTQQSVSRRIGVLVPCRNEEKVIERKLANLAGCHWSAGEHRVVVIDDGSTDETVERAEAAAHGLRERGIQVSVAPNEVRPGKPGAIQQGLVELGDSVDLIVLTDADVLVEEHAITRLAAAFDGNPLLAMASGAQRFVDNLPESGCARESVLGTRADRSSLYDRVTGRVRAFESRFGRLFSVHGQWLAWRRDLELEPSAGIAADDLALMLQVRAAHARREIRYVQGALFYECKSPPGAEADEQALRRARAYLQVLRASPRPAGGVFGRLQWHAYRLLPAGLVALPVAYGIAIGALFLVGALGSSLALWIALVLLVAAALVFILPGGFQLVGLLGVIVRATRLERTSTLPEQWEMLRR